MVDLERLQKHGRQQTVFGALRIGGDHGENWSPSWTSDGGKVIFAKREAGGFWNVWSVSRSTKMEEQRTHFTKLNAHVRYPAFSPRGNQIVFEYTESTGNIWVVEFI